MGSDHVTRGHGLLEPSLARLRAAKAESLIRPDQRSGRILDFGCGSFPFFLSRTSFAERHGLDKSLPDSVIARFAPSIALARFDVGTDDRLPYPDGHFDVITSLAVFEHIPPQRLDALLGEFHRVLKPRGSFVMTTPAGWTGPILNSLKTLRLVSPEEIDEHVDSYSPTKIRAVMMRTPFDPCALEFGYFECRMNVWMLARK
ncbi:MAG: class I SAM-dependent methyltransferase [Phycisphaeraceae bacterium]|nr:class I SAM-dependent methyltransferase [Phycisphaeraceae bacterium]